MKAAVMNRLVDGENLALEMCAGYGVVVQVDATVMKTRAELSEYAYQAVDGIRELLDGRSSALSFGGAGGKGPRQRDVFVVDRHHAVRVIRKRNGRGFKSYLKICHIRTIPGRRR